MAVRASLFLLLILRLDDNTIMFYVDLFYEVSFRFRVGSRQRKLIFFKINKTLKYQVVGLV